MAGRGGERRTARHAALDLLGRREHSLAEIRTKLAAREFDAGEIDAAITKLAGEGLLSDERFVEAFIAAHVCRGQGPQRIRGELARKGVAAELIARALEAGAHDWRVLARAARVKRFGAAPPADLRERARQHRFLEFRGFTVDHIRAALGADEDDDR